MRATAARFEVLLARSGLDDPALTAIAEIVHDIDLKDGKFGREEAAGIKMLIAGICARYARRRPASRPRRGDLRRSLCRTSVGSAVARLAMTRATTASDAEPIGSATADHGVTFGEATRVWARVAALSFGGPAGQIAVMHRILVEEKRWIGEARFLHALNYCMLLPGPEAQQLAIYIGWLLIAPPAGSSPARCSCCPASSRSWRSASSTPRLVRSRIVQALFFGLKAAVLAIVLEAVVRIGRRALKNRVMLGHSPQPLSWHLLFRRAIPAHRLHGWR